MTCCFQEMEAKEIDRTVIAKPVASRPCSNFRSNNTTPPFMVAERNIAIRPKSTRLRPLANHSPIQVVSSLADISDAEIHFSSDKAGNMSPVLYKPVAKYISRNASSVLAVTGNLEANAQKPSADMQPPAQGPDQGVQQYQCVPISKSHQDISSPLDTIAIVEPSKSVPLNLDQNLRTQQPPTGADRLSYDGYNWRKYGQKQVKGSEYPRSYYKCTHPNCPVKKKVERSLDGKIAEIVYNDEHNHPRPQPPKRLSSGIQGKAVACDGSEKSSTDLLWTGSVTEKNGGLDGTEDVCLSGVPIYSGNALFPYNSGGTGTPDASFQLNVDCDGGSRPAGGDQDEPRYKRRRTEDTDQAGPSMLVQGVPEANIVIQTSADSDVSGDGFRWRKYGQKVVKGNPYPRSYYRCTNPKCNVRKHVERSSDDPRSVVTTYEGKHNHEMPIKNPNPVASDPESLPKR